MVIAVRERDVCVARNYHLNTVEKFHIPKAAEMIGMQVEDENDAKNTLPTLSINLNSSNHGDG